MGGTKTIPGPEMSVSKGWEHQANLGCWDRLLKVGKGLVYSENQKEASMSGTQEGWGRQEAGVVRNGWITKGLVSQVKYLSGF